MIKTSRISEIIEFYHRYAWMINLLFVVYFGVGLAEIGRMKSEIKLIEATLESIVKESKITNQKLYSESSIAAQNHKKSIEFFHSIKEPLDFVQSAAFINAEDWRGEVDKIEKLFRKLLGMSTQVFFIDKKSLNYAEMYPFLKTYISSKYATQMISILLGKIYVSNCSYGMCGYFYPTIQKFGDDYFLYPYVLNSCERKYSEIRVNGNKIENNQYSFNPTHRGIHFLNIEYIDLSNGHEEVFRARKGLLVK